MLTKWAVKALDGLELKSGMILQLNDKEGEFVFDEGSIPVWIQCSKKDGCHAYIGDGCLAPIFAEIEAQDWVYSAYGKGGAHEDYSIQLDCFNAYEEIEETFTVRAKTQLEVALTALFGVVRREKL